MKLITILSIILTMHLVAKDSSFYRLKGQGEFFRNFSTLNTDRWLNTKEWKKSLNFTTKQKKEEIERKYQEEIARVMSCVGKCRLLRGNAWHDLSYRSLIVEGDTIETAKDSYLYIALKDGNMMRLSSLTKVQLPEMNLSHGHSLTTIVLVHGFIHQIDRSDDPLFLDEELIDTDPIVFPLRYQPANMELYYWRKRQKITSPNISRQQLFDHYRGLKSQADQFTMGDFKREYLINTPHGDFMISNTSFMLDLGFKRGVSWRHGDLNGRGPKAIIQKRKAIAFEENLDAGTWYQVKKGDVQKGPQLQKKYINELYLIRRGIGIRSVRDHFFLKYFDKLLSSVSKKQAHKTAKLGAKLWSQTEYNQRRDYMKKYFHFMGRRWLAHKEKYKIEGTQVKIDDYNKLAVQSYIDILKNETLRDKKIFERLNPTQFHFWLHAKSTGRWYPRYVDRIDYKIMLER